MSEEFIMDFKPEERMAQLMYTPVFELDDRNSNSSTLTAQETDSRCCIPTPPLLCKLKRCRVLIKRLPRHIIKKHSDKNGRNASSAHITPARTSKRLGPKLLPGKYLALHVNKPLKELLEKKPKKSNQLIKKTAYLGHKKNANIVYQTETNKVLNSYTHAERSQGKYNNIKSEQVSSIENQPTVSKYSDVIITKYPMSVTSKQTNQMPTNSKQPSIFFNSINHSATKASSLTSATSKTAKNFQPSNISPTITKTTTASLKSHLGNQYVIHKFNITDAAIPKTCGNGNRPQQLISIFPLENAPKTSNNTTSQQLADNTSLTSAVIVERETAKQTPKPNISPQRNISKNNAVVLNSPKVLVINQPALRSDPLNLPAGQSKQNSLPKVQSTVKNYTEKADFEPDIVDNVNAQKSSEPEVIKRIIFHSKYAQTKFTCSGNICGLVDTNGFNLNCFYCYDIFPLHKWQQFKNHIKSVHHVEEEEMESNDETPPISPTRILTPTKERNKIHTDINSLENSLNKQKDLQLNAENHNTKQLFDKTPQSFNSLIKSYANDDDEDEDDVKFKDLIQNFSDAEDELGTVEVKNENELETSSKTQFDFSSLLPPSLQHITIKKISASRCDSQNSSNQNAAEETFIKLPSNLNIQQVLKTIPKTTGHNDNTDGTKKPRYFVVKKVINPVNGDDKNSLMASKNVVLKKVPPLRQYDNDDDDMPSNDENEDPTPKPTNGCGILFGLTNRMVVIEFLLKLKTFPELWLPQQQTRSNVDCNESIKKLCDHLNNRFMLGVKDFEIRLSIQRIKNWYCRMLKNIHEHNKTCKNNQPYRHKFPMYFKILNQYLTSDVSDENNILQSSRFNSDATINNYPKWMVYKATYENTETNALKDYDSHTEEQQPIMVYKATYAEQTQSDQSSSKTTTQHPNEVSSTSVHPSTQSNTPPTTPPTTPFPELDDSTVIEFDADTLYGNESSSEEVLEEFDETKKESTIADVRKERKRTKVYLGHFTCDICNKVFKRKCDLDRHKVHHFPPKYECSICSKKFFFQHWAERCSHMRKSPEMEEENVSNTETTTTTTAADALIRIKPKWPKKIFRFKLICETCGVSYRSIGSLNTHKKDKHLNQRLKCVVCNFTAISNYRIVQHQKKRHIVEPGTVEEVAKKSRARTDTKTPFSVEARQEFDWRREMRKKLKPGEKFYGCCKCRIVFETRKEKVFHNKTEHPIKETTVLCLLCLPEKMLLSNSNSVRRHYTDIHKVPWDEIDSLVKRTKPVYNLLTKEQIELLNASENYTELLKEMLKDVHFEEVKKEEITREDIDEATKAILDLARDVNGEALNGEEVSKMEVDETVEDNVYIDGIIDHDYSNEEEYNEYNYSEEQENNENHIEMYVQQDSDIYVNDHDQHQNHEELIQQQDINVVDVEGECEIEGAIRPIAYHIECHNEEDLQEDNQVIGEFIEGQLVEECIVVEEECIDDIIEGEGYY